MEPTLYAVALSATRYQNAVNTVDHTVCMVYACSRDDATGKGFRIARKVYPVGDGWRDHYVITCAATHVIDPDQDMKSKPLA